MVWWSLNINILFSVLKREYPSFACAAAAVECIRVAQFIANERWQRNIFLFYEIHKSVENKQKSWWWWQRQRRRRRNDQTATNKLSILSYFFMSLELSSASFFCTRRAIWWQNRRKKNATPESSFNQKNERKMKPKRLCHIIKHSKSNDSLIVLIDLWIGFAHLIILFASFSYSVRRFLYVLSNEWSTPAHAKNTMICIFLIMQLNSLSEQFIDYILSNLKQCRKFDCLSNFACEKEIKRNLTWCNRKQFVDWISLSMLISIASHECAPVFVCDSSSPNPFIFERWIFFCVAVLLLHDFTYFESASNWLQRHNRSHAK